jgi:hypothetical protein
MTEAFRILLRFRDRICQLHISELDSSGHHFPLSNGSMQAFSEIASLLPAESPAIIESLNPQQNAEDDVQKVWMEQEMKRAADAIGRCGAPPGARISSEQTAISSAPIPA